MWSTETGKCYHTFKGHTAEIVCVTFNSSSTLVATGSMDTMGKIWDVESGVEMASLQVINIDKMAQILWGHRSIGHDKSRKRYLLFNFNILGPAVPVTSLHRRVELMIGL